MDMGIFLHFDMQHFALIDYRPKIQQKMCNISVVVIIFFLCLLLLRLYHQHIGLEKKLFFFLWWPNTFHLLNLNDFFNYNTELSFKNEKYVRKKGAPKCLTPLWILKEPMIQTHYQFNLLKKNLDHVQVNFLVTLSCL